ncbi:hypothetical protein R9X47_24320 [Wukongibacter baidiensis]|uniref:hypothetical protein n=1 Tax=Wukongibacter baidiensis TaxID=1723361 RepID=UPI003D7FD51B
MKKEKIGILIGSIATIILVVFGLTFLINGEKTKVHRNVDDDKHTRYENRFEIYLVKNASTQAAVEMDISDLELDDTPIVTEKDFKSYNWFNHSLEISEEVYDRIPKVSVSGLPFVVVADGERVYLGAFWTSFSSLSTSLPVIDIIQKPFAIRPGYPWDHEESNDPRKDERIYKTLNEIGKLSSDIQKHLTGEREGALKVIQEYFHAFAREDYKTMMDLATEKHNKTFVHDGNVWGMKWAEIREIELLEPKKKEKDDSTLIFLVTVDMETVETSSQYPETEGAFCITLRKGEDGIWRVDEYNNG